MTIRVPDLASRDRPRERLQEHGSSALSDAELLALVIGAGNDRFSALDLGHGLLARAGGLRELARWQLAEWTAEPGIGCARGCRLVAVFELARRARVARPSRGRPLRRSSDVAEHLVARYSDERQECFGLMLLDGRNRLLHEHVLSRGGWNASVVRPREVFREALVVGAPALILFHNHPSGDPTPSAEDIDISRRLVQVGSLLGVRVLDHLIVGAEGYRSLQEDGYI